MLSTFLQLFPKFLFLIGLCNASHNLNILSLQETPYDVRIQDGGWITGYVQKSDFKLRVEVGQSLEGIQIIEYRMFNTKSNPLERDDGSCDIVEDCHSLLHQKSLQQVQESLLDIWRSIEIKFIASHKLKKQFSRRRLTTANDILTDLYDTTGGSSWTNKNNWKTGIACPSGSWYGVTCSSTDIGGLNLNTNNMFGVLSTELGLLTALTRFRVASNSLIGTIPSQLGEFAKLSVEFALYSNALTGSIPSEIYRMTLQSNYFRIQDNSLTGSIPSEVGQLTGLTSNIQFQRNSLIGSLPSELFRITKLKSHLILNTNQFSGTLPSQIGLMSSLTYGINLISNQFSGEFPSEVGVITQMTQYLYFHKNSFIGSIPSQLGELTLLSVGFGATSNLLCGDIPSQLSAISGSVNSFFITSGNSFGTSCCESLPSIFTCSPTSVPTSLPTLSLDPSQAPTSIPYPFPTHLPLPQPTAVPIPAPSPLPTSLPFVQPTKVPIPSPTPYPTSVPTIQPTAVPVFPPTPLPTLQPSFIPSPLPTNPSPVPTVHCTSGSYLDGASCVECGIGYYSNFSDNPPWPENCTLCPAGQYSTQTAAVSCIQCESGKLSSQDRSFCGDCSAGEYSYNDESCEQCELGRYAPSPQQDECIACGAGSITNNITSSTACTSCASGTYSTGLTYYCVNCPKGTWSSFSASSCTNCTAGTFAEEAGSFTCSSCAAGQYSVVSGAYTCVECTPGKHQPATGQQTCDDCDAGYYIAEYGALSCSTCSAADDSTPGSTSCKLAAKYYYRTAEDRDTSEACPRHATCNGGNQAPAPNKGYWVDRTSYTFVTDIYKCNRLTCKGTNATSPCWNFDAYNASSSLSCDNDHLLCSQGAEGPLCGSCMTGYIFRSELKACGECDTAQALSVTAMCLMSVLCAVVAAFVTGLIPIPPFISNHPVSLFFQSFDSGSLKVIWVTFQIILSTSWNLDIKYPEPFNSLLSLLSFFSLDFLAIECFQGNVDDRYFITVYLWSTIPFIISAAIVLLMFLRLFIVNFRKSNDNVHHQTMGSHIELIYLISKNLNAEVNANIISQHTWSLLLLSYLVLPPVALKQFQSLDCIPFPHDDSFYLRADTAIDCQSHSYQSFRSIVLLFVFIYQSIPIVWMVLLFRKRSELNPVTSNNDQRLALFIRDYNPHLASLRFLFNDYKCDKWWFEVVEMYRRIAFVGLIPLTSPYTASRASTGVVLAILSVAYYREERPYRVDFTNFIAHIAQFSILITFYGALSIDTGVMMDFGLQDLGMGLFLLSTNLLIFGLCIRLGLLRYRIDQRKKRNRTRKANQIEEAGMFTAQKFKTTFQYLTRASVPVSHVLVFHYTSLPLAKLARHSGFPAQTKYDGVPFTLRQPHLTNSNDVEVFGEETKGDLEAYLGCGFPNNAVLAVSLPKSLLDPLPGYEDDEALCRISCEVLTALRPPSVSAVVDAKPWLKGYSMLSPACTIRCYSLSGDEPMDEMSSPASAIRNSVNPMMRKITGNGSTFVGDQEEEDATLKWALESRPKIVSIKMSEVIHVKSMLDYISCMKQARRKAAQLNVIPLYHFTNPNVIPLILKEGVRMSTQGQGDGGVYFSTLGPASYHIGSSKYEENIIRDCFGVHRVPEYKGLGKLNALLVYGVSPLALQQAPGGRDHAKFVPRLIFESISLPGFDGNFFLRTDNILSVMLIHADTKPSRADWYAADLELEIDMDQEMEKSLEESQQRCSRNIERMTTAMKSINLLLDDEEEGDQEEAQEEHPAADDDDEGEDGEYGNQETQRQSEHLTESMAFQDRDCDSKNGIQMTEF